MILIKVLIPFLFLALSFCGASHMKMPMTEDSSDLNREIENEHDRWSFLGESDSAKPSQTDYFDSLFTSAVSKTVQQAFGATGSAQEDPELIKLATRTISVDEAVLLVPVLFEYYHFLKSALENIEIIEIVVAAIKLRSLVPDGLIEIELNSKRCLQDWKMNNTNAKAAQSLTLSTSNSLITNSIKAMLKTLSEESKERALNEILGFNFISCSLIDFVAAKEAEITGILKRSTAVILKLKTLLFSTSSNVKKNLTTGWLALVAYKLESVREAYGNFLKARNDAREDSLDETAVSVLRWSRARVGEMIQLLAAVLEDI